MTWTLFILVLSKPCEIASTHSPNCAEHIRSVEIERGYRTLGDCIDDIEQLTAVGDDRITGWCLPGKAKHR